MDLAESIVPYLDNPESQLYPWMWSAFQAKFVDNKVFAKSPAVQGKVTMDVIFIYPAPFQTVVVDRRLTQFSLRTIQLSQKR